ncbi:hypothetical protein F4679DRAFT_587418 [Xylaria curta]|nr:hypothetical protein F4679DRAFT_587418 [Xylaria curta]
MAPVNAASDSFPSLSRFDLLKRNLSHNALEDIPRTLPQNQDEIKAEQLVRHKILNRFYASLKPSNGQYVTEKQASEAVKLLVQDCDSCGLKLDFDRIVRWAVWRSPIHGTQLIKYLVEHKNANLFQIDTEGRSAIFYCRSSHALEYIISKAPHDSQREYLNLRDKQGLTPLHYATMTFNRDAVEHLLALNADADIDDNGGRKAIDVGPKHTSLRLLFAFKKIQTARPRTAYFTCNPTPYTVLYNKHQLSGFQYNLRSPEIQYQQLESQQRERRKNEHCWIALPWTNGILAYAAMRWLERHSGQDPSVSLTFAFDWNSRLISPGNPDFVHLEPSCSLHFQSGLPSSRPISATIVFPCIVLRSEEWHKNTRIETDKLKLEVTDGVSAEFIHHERTLDETYYPSLSAHVLASRNKSQVVSREWNRNQKEPKDGPILTVPQLWIWMIGRNIISAYPEKDPENFGRLRVFSPSYLSAGISTGLIIARHIAGFDKPSEKFTSPLDFFEAGVVQVLEDVQIYTDIKTASRPDLEKEHDYMFRIVDIREELAMIQGILSQQLDILDKLISGFEYHNPESLPFLDRGDSTQIGDPTPTQDSSQGSFTEEEINIMAEEWENVKSSRNDINRYQRRANKIDNDAERAEKRIQDQLNLKRTHASIRDAEASLLAARAGLIVSAAVIGFTVITVVFAPLAFVTALFALPLDALLKNQVQFDVGGSDNDEQKASPAYTTSYVGKWFAIAEIVTLAVTIFFVLLCLWVIDETAVRQVLGKITGPLWALPEQAITYYWNIVWWILYGTVAKKKLAEDAARQVLGKITEQQRTLRKEFAKYWNLLWAVLHRTEANTTPVGGRESAPTPGRVDEEQGLATQVT